MSGHVSFRSSALAQLPQFEASRNFLVGRSAVCPAVRQSVFNGASMRAGGI
jgi:hypothetical protein